MSEKEINEIENGKQILNSIFLLDISESAELCPIINDKTKIQNLLYFLKNNRSDITEIADILKILYNLFIKNNSLIIYFTKNNLLNTINFYEPLIDLYLSGEITDDNIEIIENIIKLISKKVTMNKAPIIYLCKKLSFYFDNPENKEKIELLDENKMLKYLNLFKIFYLGENNQNIRNDIIIKEIKNYFYFNGKGSGITLNLNKNSLNPNTDFPTIEYGISFIMWIYIDNNLIKKFKEINKDCEITLLKMDINGNQIKLILHDVYTYFVSFNDTKSKKLQNNLIKINDWNSIIISFYGKKSSSLPIKLFINSVGLNSNLSLPKKFNVFTKISSIKLFEHFIGKVSSFMLITKGLDNIEANYFSNKMKYGFYKNKILFNFILNNEKNYFANCKNYKYYEKFNSNNNSFSFDFHLAKQNIKNMMGIFCPFTYNQENNSIDDIFGNFVGILGENDYANYFINNTKNIKQIGGINNLLPIVELMNSSLYNSKANKYNSIKNSALTSNTFYAYFNLIKNLIIDHSQNLMDAIDSKFFSSLIIFIQQFPSELFDDKILEILIEIGKETIKYGDNINSKGENFIDMILLNEKIIINYDIKKRMILWNILYCFFTSDDTLIKEYFNIKKICLLLRIFDSERYNHFCCKSHSEIFNIEENNKILEPEMNVRLKDLFNIIQIYINKFCDKEESINLFKLLALDLSSCLQGKIIEIYLNYFSDEKIDDKNKINSFEILVKNNFIEILEYVFSITLFDIKRKILSLFKLIFNNTNYTEILKNHLNNDEKSMNNFYLFISENLLPDQIYIKSKTHKILASDILSGDEGLIPVSNFFDKEIYEKETFNILSFLLEWALFPVPGPSNLGKKKVLEYFNIHAFILDFLISFASKCPFNYIDLLIITLSSYFNDQSISNREILFLNKNLYPWLIETIFHFHNSEINFHGYKKEDVISIKKNSLILFKDFFIHRRPHQEYNKQIYYIIRYSIHLKRIYGNIDNKKIKEVTRITRLLLEKIMGISSIYINYKTKYCFDFMLYHKNNLTGNAGRVSKNDNKFAFQDVARKSTTINILKAINKLGLNTDLILEENEEDIKDKSNDDFNKINMNSINSSFHLDDPEEEKNSDDNDDSNSLSNLSDIIPDYIFDGLHVKDLKININEKNIKDRTLKIYWEDFSLYDGIIDYYSSNVWGTEYLRKKVGIELEDDNSKLYENMIKEYGENKSNKNILNKEILKCLTIQTSDKVKKPPRIIINILYINAILLSIALVLTKGLDENIFWEGKFYQFYLFCVLVSLNINSSEENFNIIQDSIYYTLGFTSLFLKKWDKRKYNKLLKTFIIPILLRENLKKSTIFLLKKEPNTALFRLFELRQKNKIYSDDISSFPDFNQKIPSGNLRNTVRIAYKKQSEFEISPENISKDDFNIEDKYKNNYKVAFKGEYNEILNHLFSDELDKFKEEGKIHISFKSNYKTENNNKQFFSGNINNEEKLRISLIIEDVLSSYENDVYNYANEKFLEEKKRRIKYKKNKAKLFSWNGFWSNKYLYLEHPELLKLKIKNHYTKEMTRPLLVNILDFVYYLPPFKSFDKDKLFYKNNYNYKINLDIDDILSEQNKGETKENNNINITLNDDDSQIAKNKYGFNYLECSYKFSYNSIWDIYKNYINKRSKYKKLITSGKIFNEQKENNKNIFKCCIVKLTHHSTGYISTNNLNILFTHSPFSIQDFENDLTYDNEMGCCYGSIFIHKKSDKDKIYTIIDYKDIKYIFLRKYFYMETALEIFTEKNKSYFFNFKTNQDLIQFKNDLLEHFNFIEIKTEGKKVIGYEKVNHNLKKKYIMVNKKSEEWMNNNISTLEYLMWLNIYSGRSFYDLTQYPVFPWILTSYSREKDEEISFRNLSIPIGMIDLNEKSEKRRDNFIESYETLKTDLKDLFPDFNYQDYLKKGEEYLESYKIKKIKKEKDSQEVSIIELNQIPYFYGSHYSNPTYVSHFLIRIFPFSFIGIEIQGQKFDEPDRIFSSIPKTFESATTLKDDVRELVPEFYFLPELFLNDNNLDLTQNKVNSENQLILINDVELPFWSSNNSSNFVLKLRRYLESNSINTNINKWIDLIFGSNQRGEKAEENRNIFQAHTYDKMVKIETVEDFDIRNSLMRQYEMGVIPIQIFENETKSKIKNNSNNNNFISFDEGKNFSIKIITSSKFNILKSKYYENYKYSKDPAYKDEALNLSYLKISKITQVENLKIRIFTNKGHWFEIKIEDDDSGDNNILKAIESNYYKFQNNSNKYACSYRMNNIENDPIIIFNNNQSMIKGGFWDGRIEINNFNLEKTNDITLQVQTIFIPDLSPITSIDYYAKEKLFLFGSKHGNLYIYKLSDYNMKFQKGLYLFDEEITSISINDNLNMFCVSSKDGFINLHILPSYDLVRTIYLNKKENNKYHNINGNKLFANNIFLSNFPLPCITAYINSKKLFLSYTINGKLISEINECDDSYKLKDPIVYTNNNFQDILIYGTNDGLIKIRKFPEMTLINSISVFQNKKEEINALCVSYDKKYCYVWSSGNVIAVIKVLDINK